jgi:hypothetical protein
MALENLNLLLKAALQDDDLEGFRDILSKCDAKRCIQEVLKTHLRLLPGCPRVTAWLRTHAQDHVSLIELVDMFSAVCRGMPRSDSSVSRAARAAARDICSGYSSLSTCDTLATAVRRIMHDPNYLPHERADVFVAFAARLGLDLHRMRRLIGTDPVGLIVWRYVPSHECITLSAAARTVVREAARADGSLAECARALWAFAREHDISRERMLLVFQNDPAVSKQLRSRGCFLMTREEREARLEHLFLSSALEARGGP